VLIRAVQPGRLTTTDEMDRLGLVSAPELVAQPLGTPAPPARVSSRNRRWPSYERCLDSAPLNSEETGPDTSWADFVYPMIARDYFGRTEDEIVDQLMEVSTKAQVQGRPYAELTVRNASVAVERLNAIGSTPSGTGWGNLVVLNFGYVPFWPARYSP
jgi:hypothetical protein